MTMETVYHFFKKPSIHLSVHVSCKYIIHINLFINLSIHLQHQNINVNHNANPGPSLMHSLFTTATATTRPGSALTLTVSRAFFK